MGYGIISHTLFEVTLWAGIPLVAIITYAVYRLNMKIVAAIAGKDAQ